MQVIYWYGLFARSAAHACFSTHDPLVSISNTLKSHSTLCSPNIRSMSSAIFSWLSVASARIVGPAPERQMPQRPGLVCGLREMILSSPGIWRVLVHPGRERMRRGVWKVVLAVGGEGEETRGQGAQIGRTSEVPSLGVASCIRPCRHASHQMCSSPPLPSFDLIFAPHKIRRLTRGTR